MAGQGQHGRGSECAKCDFEKKAKDLPLSQIVMENQRQHDLETPVPGIVPDISNPLQTAQGTNLPTDNVSKSEESPAKESPWYYIGD